MSEGRFYLTTPIYYATGEPHLGHAFTTFLADTLARYRRQRGEEVLFLTGTDEHGQKIQEEAARREVTPRELCDDMARRFREAWDELDISFDRFIRTTEDEHVRVVEGFLTRLERRGQIYEDLYRGWYCVHEERYWTEKDLGEDRTCPDCGRPVREIEEKNYFFRMSEHQDALVRHIEENPGWILPESRRNEVLGFLRKPLEDLSISRPKSRVSWGIPLPFDPEHVAYVWVDALLNYVTASGAVEPEAAAGEGGPEPAGGADERSPDEGGLDGEGADGLVYRDDGWWPADLHLIGKDILTTHAVYWPTLLMGAGLPLPRRIVAHGWWLSSGEKMSKSLGNVVDPLELLEDFGSDAVRWYLLREMPTPGGDASYTPERFLTRYEELANVLGNLASRATSMIVRYREGRVPDAPDGALDGAVDEALRAVAGAMDEYRVHDALAHAMELARAANGYVEEREPWAQAKDPDAEADLDETLATLARVLTVLAALFRPVLPERSAVLAEHLGLDGTPTLEEARGLPLAGREMRKVPPLFPRPDLEGR